MRLILFLFHLGCCSSFAVGQYHDPPPPGCKDYQLVANALCRKDTASAIRHLDSIHAKWPNLALSPTAYLNSGRLYLAVKRPEDARNDFLRGLATPYKYQCIWKTDSSCITGNGIIEWNIKSDICIELSKMYRKEGDPCTAISYLEQSDLRYNPYMDCANGAFAHMAAISPAIAQTWMEAGDTSKAIIRLLVHIRYLGKEGTDLLTKLLGLHHTGAEIHREIRKAILNMELVSESSMTLTVFGYRVEMNYDVISRKAGRKELLKLPSVKRMTGQP